MKKFMKSFSLLLGFFLIYVLFGFYILIGVGLTYILFDFYIMLKQIPKQKQQPITIKELFNNFITGFKDFYEKLKLVLIILSILIGFIIFILVDFYGLPWAANPRAYTRADIFFLYYSSKSSII